MGKLALLSTIFLLSFKLACSIKVVVFLQGTTEQDRFQLRYIAQFLANRNHKVASVTPLIMAEEKKLVKHKLHDVRALGMHTGVNASLVDDLVEVWQWAPWNQTYDFQHAASASWKAHAAACQPMVDSDLMERIREGRYDVALVHNGQPCHLAIAHILAIPVVYFDQAGFTDETAVAAGASWPGSSIPSSDSTFAPDMDMQTRVFNSLYWLREYIANSDIDVLASLVSPRHALLDRPISDVFRNDYELKKFYDEFPTVAQLRREADLYLVNSDRALEFYGREIPPNVAFVGGYHVEAPKPLFEPWNTTISGTPEGLVILSFGCHVSFSAMPQSTLEALLEAFGRFPKRRFFVLTDDMKTPENVTVPDNVNLTRHVPQAELLATGAVKLFITNGGMHSLMEAAMFGVPQLIIPMVAPNYQNARKMEQHGLATILDKNNITADSMYAAIKTTIENPKYALAARQFRREYDERAVDGFNTLLYWIEYVGHNHGAKFYKPPNNLKHQSFWRRTGLDLVLVLLVWPMLTIRLIGYVASRRQRLQQNQSPSSQVKTEITPTKSK